MTTKIESPLLNKIIEIEGPPFCPYCAMTQEPAPKWLTDSSSGVYVACIFCNGKWHIPGDDYLVEIVGHNEIKGKEKIPQRWF